ncbi:glutamine synthetase [Stella humosa]|uniref:Glutamine synthetase n=1 Tax=Stella humosa TaxID=94 RepID=A0A3N1KI20_9PROT|nr:glutamine synthetase family protein [Stella humosa]ROP81213.1 glutamine synthetase [Stella humosa]BBK32560.1 glutamine synthetase [Stella humosa]
MADSGLGEQEIVFVGQVDLGGVLRGKGVLGHEWPYRCRWGVGWPPANLMLTPFGSLAANDFGSRGDVFIVPDPETLTSIVAVPGTPPVRLALGHLRTDDGQAWDCCPRAFLEAALADLELATGWRLKGAFEHEFLYSGLEHRLGDPFSLGAYQRLAPFADRLVTALAAAGVAAETVIPEYAPQQVEVPIAPAIGMAIADQSTIFREVVRAVAQSFGERASFTPIGEAGGVGSGAHLHFSFLDGAGLPAMHDASTATGLSARAAAFVAGIRRRLPDMVAVMAPTVVSYDRLQPHRWSAAYNTLAVRDREAALRICPVRPGTGRPVAEQFNVEFRATDGAANPYLVLGLLVRAGLEGIRLGLLPDEPLEGDPDAVAPGELARRGVERLSTSLPQALERLASGGRDLLPSALADAFATVKRAELAELEGVGPAEVIARYRAVF